MMFDTDLAMTLGVVLAVFAVPSIMSAFSDGRPPRASALTVVLAGGLIVFAVSNQPGGYKIEDLPDVFVRTVAKFIG